MRTLLPPKKKIAKLCGAQKRRPGTVWRETTNRMVLPCDGGELWYQTMTGELVLVGTNETPDEEELIDRWFLVPEGYDECAHTRSLRQILRLTRKKRGCASFTVLTTTDCNARCFYCFELGAKREHMSDETAAEAAAYMVRRCEGKDVKLHWFGGEPMYNKRACDVITTRLRELGIPYTSDMISNGYYLDRETVAHAVEDWKLNRVQITLDGTREVYNRVKAYIDRDENGHRDPDPYGRVMDNIGHCLAAGVTVWIRLNMDGRNTDDLMRLVEELHDRFAGREGLGIYTYVLHEFRSGILGFNSEEQAADELRRLNKKIDDLGLGMIFDMKKALVTYGCMADSGDGEVILPDGRVSVCDHPEEEGTVGSIFSDHRDEERRRAWQESAEYPECAGCPLYPHCVLPKHCPWVGDHCPAPVRAGKLHAMEGALRRAYAEKKAPADEVDDSL